MSCIGSKQRGATLVVSLIMLALITLLVTTAFTMSNVTTQSVGNMQTRDEAIAAANKAIEQVLSSPFAEDPSGESIDVDIDQNDTTDYTVAFDAPTCVSAQQVPATTIPPSSISLGGMFSSTVAHYYQTVWDLNANVTPTNGDGTSVRVHQGVRVLLSEAEYEDVCS